MTFHLSRYPDNLYQLRSCLGVNGGSSEADGDSSRPERFFVACWPSMHATLATRSGGMSCFALARDKRQHKGHTSPRIMYAAVNGAEYGNVCGLLIFAPKVLPLPRLALVNLSFLLARGERVDLRRRNLPTTTSTSGRSAAVLQRRPFGLSTTTPFDLC